MSKLRYRVVRVVPAMGKPRFYVDKKTLTSWERQTQSNGYCSTVAYSSANFDDPRVFDSEANAMAWVESQVEVYKYTTQGDEEVVVREYNEE